MSTEQKQTDIVINPTYPCSCTIKIETTPNGKAFALSIKYCPVHRAAPEMLRALKAIVALDDGDRPEFWKGDAAEAFTLGREAINYSLG